MARSDSLTPRRKSPDYPLDILLPKMDGFTVLKHLKGEAETKDIPSSFSPISDKKMM